MEIMTQEDIDVIITQIDSSVGITRKKACEILIEQCKEQIEHYIKRIEYLKLRINKLEYIKKEK
jgi:hypothetical protein